ncbi:hypothetical protein [Klebsiella michiganensis]|uniref:hypothetical protein n=1 Tax=Klebsiella michiganensis TaxID=1134687 RepID=UPI000666261C|nr:hypothetical protein [Klebsiella michiganensis]
MVINKLKTQEVQDYCISHFKLAPELPSGLRWIKAPSVSHQRLIGNMAGTRTAKGYYRVSVLGKRFMAHQIVYALVHGFKLVAGVRKDKALSFDHIDRVKHNNHPFNIRVADWSTQNRNRATQA